MYRSQIRDSEINEMIEKVANHNYGKFLTKLKLVNVRGFLNQTVTFDFPVTALIGPNGGGKTTIMGSAACIYSSMRPRQFFARNKQFDEAMKRWKIEYELIDKAVEPRDVVKKSAIFTTEKWTRDAMDRQVLFFGVARTLPAVERKDLLKFTKKENVIKEKDIQALTTDVAAYITRILGKQVSDYSLITNAGREIELVTGKTGTGKKYSEFHFGAGESSIIKMVVQIEAAKANALILIEEIENGLHPVATRSLVEYLIDVAKRKSLQIIFTTHSDYAIEPLPTKAVWASIDNTVFQGKLNIQTLRSITGKMNSQLVVYTEDRFASMWVQTVLSQFNDYPVDAIEIHPLGGDGNAVKINKFHNEDPSSEVPSICMIDGDSQQSDSEEERVYRLPGQCPESYIYGKVVEAWDTHGAKLTTALLQKYEKTNDIQILITQVGNTNRDPHLLFSQIGEKIFLPEDTVSRAFLAIWCQSNEDECQRIYDCMKNNILPLLIEH